MWHQGIWIQEYKPGVFDAFMKGVGKLIGRLFPYTPYLIAGSLLYQALDKKAESWLWSLIMIIGAAMLFFFAERTLINGFTKKPVAGSNSPAKPNGLLLFCLALLHAWCVYTGISEMLHKYDGGHAVAAIFAILFAAIFLSRKSRPHQSDPAKAN